MVNFVALRCPYCKYVWSRRTELMPVSCPRCKKRFDYPGDYVDLEEGDVISDTYYTMREWLAAANRYTRKCESLDEVMEKLEQL